MAKRPLYMHTLDYRPASFFKGQGVLFSGRIVVATSLRQIRREQQESRRIMAKKGVDDRLKYGYVLILQPPSTRNKA